MKAATPGQEQALAKVNVKKDMLSKAVRALTQVVAKRSANSNPLFGESAETMSLIFTLSTIPDKRKVKPVMLPLPHPMYDEKSEVCFISKDPQKKYKELLMKEHPIPGITKVIGLAKIRKNYNTVEAKRALADAFDLFLCDRNIVEMMPQVLGAGFIKKKKKLPIPVRLQLADPKPLIQKVLGGTPFRLPSGPCIGVKIGRCSMPEENLVANAASVIANVVKHMHMNPVQSISVQATDAPALPVWRRPRSPGDALDMKKHASGGASSAASDTGRSASDTEQSDALETLSSRAGDTLSELDTGGETLSEMETADETRSELDSETGDVDEAKGTKLAKADMPLVRGLKAKRKHKGVPAASAESMAPPASKKAKKAKAE